MRGGGLTVASRLRPAGEGKAPLAALQNLMSVCLSKKGLRIQEMALAGMADLPFLEQLDLSYNKITR